MSRSASAVARVDLPAPIIPLIPINTAGSEATNVDDNGATRNGLEEEAVSGGGKYEIEKPKKKGFIGKLINDLRDFSRKES